MLYLNLIEIMESKGITRPLHFLSHNGFNYHTAHKLLNYQTPTLNLKHIEKLCLLLNCTIDDLFIWQHADPKAIYKKHPLNKLRYKSAKGNITHKIQRLSPEKLDEIHRYLDSIENNNENEEPPQTT